MSCYSHRLTDGKMKHIAFMLDPDNYVSQEVSVEVVHEHFTDSYQRIVDRNCASTLCRAIDALSEIAYDMTQEVIIYAVRYAAKTNL